MASLSQTIESKVQEWLEWDQNPISRNAIKESYEKGNFGKLESLLLKRLTFGTAGLRGAMGPGYNAMNDLVIIQTSQGLSSYCMKQISNIKSKGVVIGYDARHNSQRFAQLTALAFLNLGIPVYIFSKIVPTPFVAYSVVELGCGCGIMVTASHNPKEDNGYKVFWENGAQIIPPHDTNIQESIENNLKPYSEAWNVLSLENNSLVKDPLEEIKKKYYHEMEKNLIDRDLNLKSPIKFTYTAMHGVSHEYMTIAFEICGFQNYIPVEAQMKPDPEFPTVKFPNPEEGKSCLDLSIKTAQAHGSSIILANDPDADRLAVAEQLENGEWKVFTGNELGALLGSWMWKCFKNRHPEVPASEVYMISSAVSSKILKSIAKYEGFNFEETLTGFKWMANKAEELMLAGKTILFVFEEAIGFMCGTTVLDKDGIGAAMQISQLAAHLEKKNLTLNQELINIYKKYGLHTSRNSYFICHNQDTIASMFKRLRNYNGNNKYPENLGSYKITAIRDLTDGYDNTQPDNIPILPTSKSSQMITFYFQNNYTVTLRTSGTEPKIKYYIELCALPTQQDWNALESDIDGLEELVKEEWFQPTVNNLIARSD